MHKSSNLFIVWNIYQRRAESLADYLDLHIIYYHYKWEKRSKLYKAFSYVFKSWRTCIDIIRYRPNLVFVQLGPTPPLYIVGLYALLTGRLFIADCHNAMIAGWWLKWPFARNLLNRANTVLVHNPGVKQLAEKRKVHSTVIRDPLPRITHVETTSVLERFDLQAEQYVIVPWNLAWDEPIAELVEGVKHLPNIQFAMTWFSKQLPKRIVDIPSNLIFTGFLEVAEFNDLFSRAGAAISLTTQTCTQPSAAAESLAFGVPFIVSDSETSRQLYSEAAVFVNNEPSSIADGVKDAMTRREELKQRVVHLRETIGDDLRREVDLLQIEYSDFI